MAEQPYTLARWLVAPGNEDAFVAAWHDLAAFFLSLKQPPRWGTLLRSMEDPRLFYSFGPWPSTETIAAMRADPARRRRSAGSPRCARRRSWGPTSSPRPPARPRPSPDEAAQDPHRLFVVGGC